MNFTNSDDPLSESEIARCEADLAIRLPSSLRECYLIANGGEPNPYVFQNAKLDTVVTEFLPLKSRSRGTSVQCYRRLVLEKKLVHSSLFPFAVDGGGDYFFTDMQTSEGAVYFYRSDSINDPLLKLNLGIDDFWAALKPE
jgi:cell wall assembly regulator SMI1